MYGRRKILYGTTKTLFKILATFCILSLSLDNNNNQARMYFVKIILCLSYFFRLSLGHMRISMCWAWVVSLSGSCFVFLIIMNLPTANFCWRHFDDKMFSRCTVMELSRFQTRSVSHFRDPKALTFKTRLSQNLSCENELYLHENKKLFLIHGFVPSLTLKQRLGATWKWWVCDLTPHDSILAVFVPFYEFCIRILPCRQFDMHCRRKPLVFISPEYYARVVPRDYKTILIMQNLGEAGGGGWRAKKVYCGRCVRNKMASPKIMRQRNCKWNRHSLQNPSTGAWSKAKLTFVCLVFFLWVFLSIFFM